MDPYAAVGLSRKPDGSFARTFDVPRAPPSSNLTDAAQVLSKDVPLNSATGTSLRIFLPPNAAKGPKIPIIIYAAGGGFVIHSSVSTLTNDFCSALASRTPALVISLEYRDAPEHRLPAAYVDYEEAIDWVNSATDDWITAYGDSSNCYLMGTSAGANMALRVGLRIAGEEQKTAIKGLILHQLFVGGVERTASEIANSAASKTLPLPVSDVMWELALPVGATRDHEYCNPMKYEHVRRSLGGIKKKGWKVAVTGCSGDTLVDRQREAVAAMEAEGVAVLAKFVEGEYHGYDIFEPSKTDVILTAVKETVY